MNPPATCSMIPCCHSTRATMPRDFFAEGIDAMRCAGQSVHPVNISAPACRAILARLAYLEHDNDTLRRQHATWHQYAITEMTPAQMEMRLREIEAESNID